jgi:ApaG protein
MIYEATTRGERIRATPTYLPDQSDPDEGRHVWAYGIEIVNEGFETVQLTARRWVITDARGVTRVVEGPGVVGEQPILRPGDGFSYTSGCPLDATSGLMSGHYEMVTDAGETFLAVVPPFPLDVPGAARVVH